MKIFTYKIVVFFFLLFCTEATFGQTADFTADKLAGCSPLVVTFTDKSSGTITNWSWDFGDFSYSSLPNPSKSFDNPGTYTVKLTVRNGGGTPSTKSLSIVIYPSPKVSFTASPVKGCPCSNITFTNTSVANAPGAYTSLWSFGDGYTAATNNTSHTYCVSGKYNVALQVKNSVGCITAKLDTSTVEIFEKPETDFSATKINLCKVPDTTQFYSSTTKGKAPYTYSWEFGDAGTSTLANPSHIYLSAGSYTVRLIITDANGCKDSMEKFNYIKAVPMNSTFSVPSSICAGVSMVRFDNTSTPTPVGTKWFWSDGGSYAGLTAQRDFWKGGTYTITMIDSFGPGCKDTAVNTYTVHPKPVANFSYSPIYSCPAPADISFTNKSRGTDSFQWIFGDGTSSKLKDPVHTYTHDSVFTVYMIAKTSFGCLDTFRVRDTTKPFPLGYASRRYDSSNSPIIIRVFNAIIGVTPSTNAGCIPLTVNFGAKLYTTTHLPSVGDTMKPVPSCGNIIGYLPPYWYCTDLPHPDPYPDDFEDIKSWLPGPYTYIYPYPRKSVLFEWNFGDGATATTTTSGSSHIYTTEGRFIVKCTITTEDGCKRTDSTFVEAGFKPTVNFSFYPDTICKNDYVYATNLSTGGLKYIWDWNDSYTLEDTSKNVNHQYRVSGNRRIILWGSRYGCLDSMSKPLVINPPGSSFGIRFSCDTPFKVAFLDSSYRATSTFWEFGDGATSTLRNPIHTYSDTGVYTVRLTTTNDSFSCVDTTSRTIYIFNKQPTFTALDTTVCLGDTVFLTHPVYNYITQYNFGSGSVLDTVYFDPTRQIYYVVYKDTGRYSVTLYSRDIHKCDKAFTRNKYITVAKPWMKVKASPMISCAPATINFTDNSTNTSTVKNISRTWYWGDATFKTDTSVNATKLYPIPGKYTVKVVTTDIIGCKDSINIDIESRKPVADFGAAIDTFTCLYKPIKFVSLSSGAGLTYKWYFGDGATSTLPDPEHAYSTIGSFDVKLVVTDETGCKDSITKLAFVKTVKPNASFTMSDSVALCPPLFVTFTNTSSADAVRFTWDFDEGYAAIPSPVAPFIDSGVYIITMVAYDKYGCTDTAYSRVRVLGYDGALKYTPLSGCAPLTVSFEAELVKADVMVWDFADGVTESAVGKLTTTHTYTEPGSYIPRLILGDGKGCSTSSRGLDTIRVDAAVAVVKMTPTCINTPITFTDSSYSYFSAYASSEWTFEDGTTAAGKTTKRTYSKEGTYTITLITTNTNGCKDTIQKTFTVFGLPVIKAKDTVICLNDQATLSAGGGVSYYWNPAPTLSCSDCNNPVTSTKVPVKYIVTGTDERGCTNKDTLDVGIKIKTTLLHTADTEICERDPIQLLASGAHNYYWSPATFLSADNIPNPIATMDSTIIYRVIGTEGSCIPDTAMIKVTVHPLPEVDAGADQKVLAGTEVQLSGNGKYIKDYLWSPAATLSCASCQNPVAKPLTTTIYTLTGTSDFGCSDSDKVQITIFCDQSQLYIPNTFTPNGDGLNDYFYPQGKGVGKIKAFTIFNRWGQKVFEKTAFDANAKEQGWDGTFNGDALSPDTFVYTIEATCDNGEIVFIKGDVTIIK